MKKKYAFTLAEILVTLMIIGVISMMTIPVLQKSAQNNAHVSAAKKAYMALSNVYKSLSVEKGSIRFWTTGGSTAQMAMEFKALFESKFNVISNKESLKAIETNSNVGLYYNSVLKNSDFTFIALDGMFFTFLPSIDPLAFNREESLAVVIVDTNGKKGPNKVGFDIVGFQIKDDFIYPTGEKDIKKTCSNSSPNFACTEKMIIDGKITWH